MTTGALQELCSRDAGTSFFTAGGWYYGTLAPHSAVNVQTRIAQFQLASRPGGGLPLARAFVSGKILNGRTLLRRNARARPEALDLMEEFRPLIADSTVLAVLNNGSVQAPDFARAAGGFALGESGRRAFLDAFERRMAQEITHPVFEYRITYRRVLEVQARLLARVIVGELPEYPSFQTR